MQNRNRLIDIESKLTVTKGKGEGRDKLRVGLTDACVLSRFSHVQLFATLWTVARQASLSMSFSGQEYWSGLPFPPPGSLPDPGIKHMSAALQVDSLPFEPPGKPCPQHMCPQLNHFAVHLKLTQHCKPTTLRHIK